VTATARALPPFWGGFAEVVAGGACDADRDALCRAALVIDPSQGALAPDRPFPVSPDSATVDRARESPRRVRSGSGTPGRFTPTFRPGLTDSVQQTVHMHARKVGEVGSADTEP
jgi:hypothetical protein